MLTDEELANLLAKSPAPRITREYMLSRIMDTQYITQGTTTICLIQLDNGYRVLGESACVNPENYNRLIGEKVSYDNAFMRL